MAQGSFVKVIVDDPWTFENDLLTPTLKFKRDKLEARYAELIRRDSGKIVWSEVAGR